MRTTVPQPADTPLVPSPSPSRGPPDDRADRRGALLSEAIGLLLAFGFAVALSPFAVVGW